MCVCVVESVYVCESAYLRVRVEVEGRAPTGVHDQLKRFVKPVSGVLVEG